MNTTLVPSRVTASRVPRTDPTAIDNATGRMRTPVLSGPKPATAGRTGDQEDEANNAKNATVTGRWPR